MSKTNSLHYELCKKGAEWIQHLRWGGYKYIAVELNTASPESTDVWGTNGCNSIVIEVKVSHADFVNDKNKFIRKKENADMAAGNYHYYLAPKGIINVDELPENWGLLEWDGRNIEKIKEAENVSKGNYGDMMILCSIMRREGIKRGIFNYRKNEIHN